MFLGKRLYDSTHDWKLIPLHIKIQKYGKHFLFHSNLYIDQGKLCNFLNIVKKYYCNRAVIYQ